jgi:2-keto-4-pentenoate hydratase
VADNASSGLYVLSGNRVSIDSLDLKQMACPCERNGKLVNTGVGAAALGHPAYCVAWLANKMGGIRRRYSKKAKIVLSGALSAGRGGQAGAPFTAQFSKLGDVSVSFTE